MSKITNIGIQEFLFDYKTKSETVILEEGKEKNELIQIAKAKGMDIKNSRDLALFKTIYAFTDKANSNGAILPQKDLLKVLPQIIGKPININHDRRLVVGHYVDYKYIQKSNQIIAYGVFYKSYFAKEWEAAQNLLRKKKLSTSFEIWSPEEKRVENEDGSYELHQMEIAGGAFIYEDEENIPAFKDAKVLALAKKEHNTAELVYASKYSPDEIITCKDGKCKLSKSAEQVEVKDEIIKEELVNKTEETVVQPTVININCSNCNEEFEISGYDTNIKCPKCLAIVNQKGEMIYPPQIKDFQLLCQSCNVNNWLILSNKEDKSKIRCMNCAKEYEVTYKKAVDLSALDKLTFLYSGVAHCIQCNKEIVFEGSSKIKQREFKCPKCGLTFTHNITKMDRKRIIASIQEIGVEILEKSKEGGKPMEQKKKIEETKEVKKVVVEDVKVIKKDEPKAKVEETKSTTPAKDASPKENAPKAEVKVEEPKEEVKEVVEKVAEPKIVDVKLVKKETILADVEYEKQFEATKEDVNELTISKVVEFAKLNDKIADLETAKGKDETAKSLTSKERKELSDDKFAVVVTIKNKKSGKERKVRRYPINDKAHIRNALSNLAKPETKATLDKLGADIEAIRSKILDQAKKMIKTSLLKKRKDIRINTEKKVEIYKAGINKVVKQLIEAKAQVELYKTDAKEIIKRRELLGDFADDVKDVDLLNDDKFERAKLEKEKALITASEVKEDDVVGAPKKDGSYYTQKQKEIDEFAFGKNKNK